MDPATCEDRFWPSFGVPRVCLFLEKEPPKWVGGPLGFPKINTKQKGTLKRFTHRSGPGQESLKWESGVLGNLALGDTDRIRMLDSNPAASLMEPTRALFADFLPGMLPIRFHERATTSVPLSASPPKTNLGCLMDTL